MLCAQTLLNILAKEFLSSSLLSAVRDEEGSNNHFQDQSFSKSLNPSDTRPGSPRRFQFKGSPQQHEH